MLKERLYAYFRGGEATHQTKIKTSDRVFFNPSSFSACRRQIYYKKTGKPSSNPISAASYLKMDFGTVLHTRIQAIIKKQGILLEAEKLKVVSLGGLKFRYKTDGIILLGDKKYIMEIKTTHAGGFRAIKEAPKPEDVIQMALYMLFENVENAVLLYVGRDNGHMEEYVVRVGDPLYRKALSTISTKLQDLKVLEEDIKKGHLPGRDCSIVMKNKGGEVTEKFQKDKKAYKSAWQCEYCQWHDLCWKDELEEIKQHLFYINGEFLD